MKVSAILCAIFIISLSSCNKKEEKLPVMSDLLIDDFDFTKDVGFRVYLENNGITSED
ncbi:hypothetical protein NZD88_19450 [Chryseobacterium antibioticum]|uniref:Uncharacterized protein n=1 Tax=Chryseobacterium pyrolae TaxID=2987481 RepID=A0ABT2IN11_9FLAO|nr:hypothetical protein [Chryseobacterium pyrolae]MCT2409733.1 hypothetical protein [Chryseobacterium pyrolae]